jgi:hypothetical protein
MSRPSSHLDTPAQGADRDDLAALAPDAAQRIGATLCSGGHADRLDLLLSHHPWLACHLDTEAVAEALARPRRGHVSAREVLFHAAFSLSLPHAAACSDTGRIAVPVLARHGTDFNLAPAGLTPLVVAVTQGHMGTVRSLLEHGASLEFALLSDPDLDPGAVEHCQLAARLLDGDWDALRARLAEGRPYLDNHPVTGKSLATLATIHRLPWDLRMALCAPVPSRRRATMGMAS